MIRVVLCTGCVYVCVCVSLWVRKCWTQVVLELVRDGYHHDFISSEFTARPNLGLLVPGHHDEVLQIIAGSLGYKIRTTQCTVHRPYTKLNCWFQLRAFRCPSPFVAVPNTDSVKDLISNLKLTRYNGQLWPCVAPKQPCWKPYIVAYECKS